MVYRFEYQKGVKTDIVTVIHDGDGIGYLELTKHASPVYANILEVYIDERHRAQGLFKRMMRVALIHCGRAYLCSWMRNDKTNKIYEQWTFRKWKKSTPIYICLKGRDIDFRTNIN